METEKKIIALLQSKNLGKEDLMEKMKKDINEDLQ